MYFVVAAIFLPVMLVVGIGLVREGAYRYMLVPFLVAVACALTLYYCWRTSFGPVARRYDAPTTPGVAARVTELSLDIGEMTTVYREWVNMLSTHVTQVIDSAMRDLRPTRRRYKVAVKLTWTYAGRESSLGFRGSPEKEGLAQLFDDVEKLPAFTVPSGTLKLELWFAVC